MKFAAFHEWNCKEKLTIQPTLMAFSATKHDEPAPEPDHVLSLVQSSLEDDKAEDTVVIPLSEKSDIADYLVIASGRSARQVGAMADHLREKLKAAGVRGISTEGMERSDWVLLDAGDVIVHLFRPEVRTFYNLEKMWGLELPEDRGVDQGQSGTA